MVINKNRKISLYLIFALLVAAGFSMSFAYPSYSQLISEELQAREAFVMDVPASYCVLFPDNPGRNGCLPKDLKNMEKQMDEQDPLEWTIWSHFSASMVNYLKTPNQKDYHINHLSILTKKSWVKNWLLARSYMLNGHSKGFKKFIGRASHLATGREFGTRPYMAQVIIHDVRLMVSNKQFEMAHVALDQAELLNPVDLIPTALRIKIYIQSGIISNFESISQLWGKLLLKLVKQNSSLALLLSARVLRITFEIFFTVLLFGFFLRYFRRSTHYWAEKFPRIHSLKKRYFLILVLLCCFPLSGLGLTALMILAWYFIWPYLKKSEQKTAIANYIFIICLPILLFSESIGLAKYQPEILPGIYEYAREYGWETKRYKQLNQMLLIEEDHSLVHTSLSLMESNRGNTQKALFHANQALEVDDRNPIALNHSGNLYSQMNEYKKARSYYRRAYQKGEDWPELLYNLGHAETAIGNHITGQLYLSKGDWTSRKLGLPIYSAYPHRRQEISTSWRELLKYQWNRVLAGKSAFLQWRAGLLDIPLWLLPVIVALTLLFLPLRRKWWMRTPFSGTCQACGSVICNHCSTDVYCESCAKSAYNLPDDSSKEKIINSIKTKSAQRRSLIKKGMNLLFPGAGEIANGNQWLGGVLVLFVSFLWSIIIVIKMAPTKEYMSIDTVFDWALFTPIICMYFVFIPPFLLQSIQSFRLKKGEIIWR